MRKSLFSICLLVLSSLAWSGVHIEPLDPVAYSDLDVTMHDAAFDSVAVVALVTDVDVRSMAAAARAEQRVEGHRDAVARMIGSGSSGMARIGVSTTASNPPDI